MIKLIWAMDPNRVVGKNNILPWRIKEELRHFSKTTRNNDVLFGRTTFANLPGKLKDRKIFVLTRNKNLISNDPDVVYTHDLSSLMKKYENSEKTLYVCGGVKVYEQTLEWADELIITEIKKEYEGDVFFPEIDMSQYKLIKTEKYDKFNIKYYRRIY